VSTSAEPFPVAQLPQVEVADLPVEAGQPVPTEENVAGGLHQALPGDNALAAVGVLAFADEPFQHRFLSFFRLQEQRVLVVPPEHEQNPGARANAADADDLPGHVGVVEVLQQVPPVGLKGAPVAPDDAPDLPLDLVAFSPPGATSPRSGRSVGSRR
jgi:hypothetical protein